MAYNGLTAIRQQPYYTRNNMGLVKKKEDEESSKSSQTQQAQEEQRQQQKTYNSEKSGYEQLKESKQSYHAAVTSRDASLKNATVNIAQIIKDFKNTSLAIGATPEITEEVNAYLDLVEKQVKKETPDIKLVKSNLKNASSILDNFIAETLQRPSNVVENWIEALFLQQINYQFNEEEINPQFLVKFPNQQEQENEIEPQESTQGEVTAQVKNVIVPEDDQLKSLFIQGKKYSYANDSSKALESFKDALARAVEIQDKETESKVLFEIGKIYDKNDYLAQALTSYNKSLQSTSDYNVKTQAHYSMAQIYDDIAQFEPAINHYMSSISFAGESENLVAQSASLAKIGGIFTDKYNKNALEFLNEAELIANESKNSKAKGYVSSSIANTYDKFNEPQKALQYYSSAVKEYKEANLVSKVAINYKSAAEIMQGYNNPQKAKKLLEKALNNARQTDDVQLMKEIHDALNML